MNLVELKEDTAVQFAAEVTNNFTALEAARNEVTLEDLWKGTKTVLLEVAREKIGSVKSQKKMKLISDKSYAAIEEKRGAKGKDKNRYQDLKAEVQRKLRVDKQQQLEGICMEVEAANSKGNSRKLFQIVKSMTRKFQPRLQGIQSATGENLTEAAQIADKWKGYCDEERKGIEQEYCEQEPLPLLSEVPFIRQLVAKQQVPAELFITKGETVLD